LFKTLYGFGNIITFTKIIYLPVEQNIAICKCDTFHSINSLKYTLSCDSIKGKYLARFRRKFDFIGGPPDPYLNFPLIGKVFFFDCIPTPEELLIEDGSQVKYNPLQLAMYISGFCQHSDYSKFIINTSRKASSVSENLKKGNKYKLKGKFENDNSIGVEISSSVKQNTATIEFSYYTGIDLKNYFYK
jgi:hypothetical protein